MLPGSRGGTGSCADMDIFNAHQSIAAGASSKIVVEMVRFSFWYLLAQFLLLFTSRFFWNHLSNGNIRLVLFQGEITRMVVERHCLGLAAKCYSKTSVLPFLNLTVQFGGSEAKE